LPPFAYLQEVGRLLNILQIQRFQECGFSARILADDDIEAFEIFDLKLGEAAEILNLDVLDHGAPVRRADYRKAASSSPYHGRGTGPNWQLR
jgi:hypothetical protein